MKNFDNKTQESYRNLLKLGFRRTTLSGYPGIALARRSDPLVIVPFAPANDLLKPTSLSRWHELVGHLCALVPLAGCSNRIFYFSAKETDMGLNPVYYLSTAWYMSVIVPNQPKMVFIQSASVEFFLRKIEMEKNQTQRLKDQALFDFYAAKADLDEKLLNRLKRKPLDKYWDPLELGKRSAWIVSILEGVHPIDGLTKMRPTKASYAKEKKLFSSHPHLWIYWLWAALFINETKIHRDVVHWAKKEDASDFVKSELKRQSKFLKLLKRIEFKE